MIFLAVVVENTFACSFRPSCWFLRSILVDEFLCQFVQYTNNGIFRILEFLKITDPSADIGIIFQYSVTDLFFMLDKADIIYYVDENGKETTYRESEMK